MSLSVPSVTSVLSRPVRNAVPASYPDAAGGSSGPGTSPPAPRPLVVDRRSIRVSRESLAANRNIWFVVGAIYAAMAGASVALILSEPVPTLRMQVLAGILVAAAVAHLTTKPPTIGSVRNHVVVALPYVASSAAMFAIQPAGSLGIGGVMFVAPFVAVRLLDRRQIAAHILVASMLLLAVAVSGLAFGLVDRVTQIACLLLMAGTCVQCFTCAVMLEAAEKQGDELELLTRSDPLTGVGNRRHFTQRLDARIEAFRQAGGPFSVVIVDLNDFKAVNDRAGHLVGDEVLKIVATRLRSIVGAGETLVRMGGDEFCLILDEHGTGPEANLASVRKALTSVTFNEFEITAGVGGASCPADATDPDALQHLADARLREDKHRYAQATKAQAADRRKSAEPTATAATDPSLGDA